MESVQSILLWERLDRPRKFQNFQFDMPLDAAQQNWPAFASFERSLAQVIASDPNSIMAYGSEFKLPEILAPLATTRCMI
jgi:hypothetical protein